MMKLIFVISCLLFLPLVGFGQTSTNGIAPIIEECSKDTSLTMLEKLACSDKKFIEFIYSELKYPSIARENGMEGTMLVELVINAKGIVENGIILRTPKPEKAFFKEGTRLIELIKEKLTWTTVLANNSSDKISIKLPIYFTLESKKTPLLRRTENITDFICERDKKFSFFHVKKNRLSKIYSKEFDINSMWYYKLGGSKVDKVSLECNGKVIESKGGVFSTKMIELLNQTPKGGKITVLIEEVFNDKREEIKKEMQVK